MPILFCIYIVPPPPPPPAKNGKASEEGGAMQIDKKSLIEKFSVGEVALA